MTKIKNGNRRSVTKDIFDEFSERYATAVNDAIAFTGADVDTFARIKATYIEDLCRAYFPRDCSIKALDIGCGVGTIHSFLSGKVGNLSGVDISPASIARAKQKHPDNNYWVYDGARLPFEANTFDLAFAVCVLHHVPPDGWRQFVGEMHRVLRSGGLALIFEHNPFNPLTRMAVNNCPFDADAVLLRSRTTKAVLREAKFRHIEARFILAIPAATRWLRKIDRLFSHLPLGAQYYVRAEKA